MSHQVTVAQVVSIGPPPSAAASSSGSTAAAAAEVATSSSSTASPPPIENNSGSDASTAVAAAPSAAAGAAGLSAAAAAAHPSAAAAGAQAAAARHTQIPYDAPNCSAGGDPGVQLSVQAITQVVQANANLRSHKASMEAVHQHLMEKLNEMRSAHSTPEALQAAMDADPDMVSRQHAYRSAEALVSNSNRALHEHLKASARLLLYVETGTRYQWNIAPPLKPVITCQKVSSSHTMTRTRATRTRPPSAPRHMIARLYMAHSCVRFLRVLAACAAETEARARCDGKALSNLRSDGRAVHA